MSDKQNHLWKVEDGETHWVSAQTREEALGYLLDMSGCATVEEYEEEHEPIVEWVDYTQPHRIRFDCPRDAELAMETLPKGSRLTIEVVIPANRLRDIEGGLVSSTVY